MASLLEIEDLHTEIRLRSATVHALEGVSLSVEAGECLGIVGESGCGKTMTALSIMQLLPPGGHIVGGQISLDGQEISSLNEEGMRHVRGNEVGMIFQDPMTSLNPTMTVGEQIAETVLLHRGADAKTARARAIEVLGLVGMPRPAERVSNYPHQLSGGMLSDGVQYVYDGYWWLIIPAGFCIVIVIAAAIFIGEGLRDAVEVRLQRR